MTAVASSAKGASELAELNAHRNKVNGRFGARTNSAPEAELEDGTFAFPPPNEDPDQVIEFLRTAPISDRILSNAKYAYLAWRKAAVQDFVNNEFKVWDASDDRKLDKLVKNNPLEFDRLAQNFIKESEMRAFEVYPYEKLPERSARALLRAHQIKKYSFLDPEKFARATVEIPSGEELAIPLADDFHTDQWADRALTETDLATADAMSQVASLLKQQQG